MDILGNIFYSEPIEEPGLFRLDLNGDDIDQSSLSDDIVGRFYGDALWFTFTTSSIDDEFENLPFDRDDVESRNVRLGDEELWSQVYSVLLRKSLLNQTDDEFYPIHGNQIFEYDWSVHHSGIEYRKGVEIDFMRNQDEDKIAIAMDRTYFAEDLDREDLEDDIPSPTPKIRFRETKNLFKRITPNKGDSIAFNCFGEKIELKFSPARWEK